MSQDKIYTYDKDQNPNGGHIPGVPRRDLTAADLDDLPKHIRDTIAATPFYVPSAVRSAAERGRRGAPAPSETKAEVGS